MKGDEGLHATSTMLAWVDGSDVVVQPFASPGARRAIGKTDGAHPQVFVGTGNVFWYRGSDGAILRSSLEGAGVSIVAHNFKNLGWWHTDRALFVHDGGRRICISPDATITALTRPASEYETIGGDCESWVMLTEEEIVVHDSGAERTFAALLGTSSLVHRDREHGFAVLDGCRVGKGCDNDARLVKLDLGTGAVETVHTLNGLTVSAGAWSGRSLVLATYRKGTFDDGRLWHFTDDGQLKCFYQTGARVTAVARHGSAAIWRTSTGQISHGEPTVTACSQ